MKKLWKEILKRSIALIILKVSGTLAAGSLFGADILVAAGMAIFVGLMEVAESLSRAYIVDGELNANEVNTAFASYAEADASKEKEADK
jgi:hypothetical protein